MQVSDLEMYEILKERMSEKEAREFISYIESKVEEKFVEAKNIFSTKEDLLKLELRITQLINESKAETIKLISDSKAETIKWMFVFCVTTALAIIGTIIAVMRMGGWGN